MRIQWLCAGAAQEISPKTATTKPDKPKAKRQSTKTKKASDTSGSKKGSKTLTARSGRQLARFQSDSEQGQEWKTELKLMADAAKQKEKGDDKMITSPSKKSRTPLNTSQSKLSGIRARTLTDKTGPQGASPSFQEEESMGEIVLADPERLGEIEALIASGTAEGNPCRDFGMFCDQENPQWFAVKVNQPDTSSALRVQSLVQYALKRHPKMTMPNGLEVTRQIEIVVPRKPIQAWSARSGKMGNRTITWKEGAFVMFKTIMDSTLAGYFQPWFLDPSDFWWKRMGATPRSPCITEFVNGLRIRTHYHIPRPCPESLLTEMNEWLETEEEWDEAKVTQNDSNAITSQEDRRPMDVREPGRADREQWRRVVERSGGRPLEELQTERLMLKGVINENVSHAESAVHSQKLAELESMDAGGWNVGIVDFKRQGHYQKRKQQPGRGLEFNRAKFAEDIGARRNTQRKTHFRNESSSSLPVNRVQGARTPSVSTSSPRMKDNSSGATGWYDGENDQYPWAYERDSNQGRNSWFTDEAVPSSSREASLGSQSLSSEQSRQKSSRSESKPADKIGWYDEDGKSVSFDEDSWLYGGKSSANGPPSQKAQSSDKPKSERLGREIDAVELASSDWKDAKDFWQEDDSWAQSQNQDAHPRSSTRTQPNQSQWYEGSDLNETPAPMQSGWYQAASALRDQNTPQKKSIPSKFDRFDRSQSSKALPDLEQGGMRKSDPKTSETRPQNSEKDTCNEDSWAAWDSENDWFSDLSSQSNLNAKFTDGLESQAANSPQNKLDPKGSLSPEEQQPKVDPWDEWSNEEVNDRRQGGGAKFGSARPVLRLSDFDDDLGLDNEPTSIQRSVSRASSLQNPNAIQNKGSGSKFDKFAPGPPKSSLTRQTTRSRQANVNDQDATSRRIQNPVQNSPEVGRIAKGSPAIKSSSAVSQRSTKQDSQDDVWAAWDQEDSWFSGTNESSSRELSDTGTLPSDDTSTQESLRTGDKTSKVQQAMTNKNDSLTEESSQVFWADDMNFSDTASQVPTLPQQKAAQSRTFSHKDTSTGTKSNEDYNIERNNEVSQARLHTVDGLLEGDEKLKLGNLAVGSMVRVTKGRYKGAEGDVINVRKTVAKIKFHDGQGQAEISIASCLPIVSADDF